MKILLAIDASPCSDAALAQTLRQFAPADTDVLVLHVDEWPKGLPDSFGFAEGPTAAHDLMATRDEMHRQGEELVARASARLNASHFHAHTEVRRGDARREILDCAARWHPDIIVVGSHGRRGFDRFLLGSVSDGVVRQAACSVQVVRAPA